MYRSFIDDRIGEDIFCIKTRSSAKASGEQVGEVLFPNVILQVIKPTGAKLLPEADLTATLCSPFKFC